MRVGGKRTASLVRIPGDVANCLEEGDEFGVLILELKRHLKEDARMSWQRGG